VYTLAIPNSEVRVGLLRNLLPLYATIRNVTSVVARTPRFPQGRSNKP